MVGYAAHDALAQPPAKMVRKAFAVLQEIKGVHALLQGGKCVVDGIQGLYMLGRFAYSGSHLGQIAFYDLLPRGDIAVGHSERTSLFLLARKMNGGLRLLVKIIFADV